MTPLRRKLVLTTLRPHVSFGVALVVLIFPAHLGWWGLVPLGFFLALGLVRALSGLANVRDTFNLKPYLEESGWSYVYRTQLELPVPPSEAMSWSHDAISRLGEPIERAEAADASALVALNMPKDGPVMGTLVKMALDGHGTTTRVKLFAGPSWEPFGVSTAHYGRVLQLLVLSLNDRAASYHLGQREAAEKSAIQAKLDKARLALLQAQVQPHFLYNTLANVQLLIRDDPARADRMTGDLIDYLRLSLPSARSDESTVSRELALIRAYLGIMKVRMGARLHVDIESDDDVAGEPVPSLLVHTLVENAIKHGLEPKEGGGRIVVRVHRGQPQRLRIVVEDDGVGLRPHRGGGGVGLENLRERLAIRYDGAASFRLEPREPSGVTCVVEMPMAQVDAS